MSATLKKITTRAKLLRKKNPSLKYTVAVKKAAIELRQEGAIGAVKKVVKKTVKRKRHVIKKPVSKNRIVTLKETLKKDHLKLPHGYKLENRLSGVSSSALHKEIKDRLVKDLAKAYVKYEMAKTVKLTKMAQKEISAIKIKLRKFK